jgi:phosphate transport system substrate-binding protein
MKKLLILFFGAVTLASLPGTHVNAQKEQEKVAIRVVSHTSMYNRTNVVSKLYMHRHPNVNIAIEKVPLVQDSLAMLTNDSIDVVMASRLLNDQESDALAKKGMQVYERLIGYGGLVIITDRANTLTDLTMSQVKKLLTGEISNWKEIGGPNKPVVVVSTGEEYPGTKAFLQSAVLGGTPIKKEATVVPGFNKMMFTVSQTPGSVGFVRIADAFESPVSVDAPVKVMKIKQTAATVPVMPSRQNLENGLYPIKRPYYLYYRQDAKPEVVSYVEFVLAKGWGPNQ